MAVSKENMREAKSFRRQMGVASLLLTLTVIGLIIYDFEKAAEMCTLFSIGAGILGAIYFQMNSLIKGEEKKNGKII